jgi:hypothetical protein
VGISYKLFILVWCPIALISAFNDFPLFAAVSILRSPSIFPYILSLPMLAIWFWRVPIFKSSVSSITTFIYVFWGYLFLAFVYNFFVTDLYESQQGLAFDSFFRALITASFFLVVSLTFQTLSCSIYQMCRCVNHAVLTASWALIVYGLIELFAKYNAGFYFVLNLLEPIFHDRPIGDYFSGNSLRSLSFEPSYLVLPLVFLLGLNFIHIDRKHNMLVAVLLIGLGIMSGSRLAAVLLMATISIYVIVSRGFGMKIVTYAAILCVPIGFLLADTISSLLSLDSNQISNIQRYGSYLAGIYLFMDNFFVGVGFGLGGGFISGYYPDFFYGTYTSLDWVQSEGFGGSFMSWPIRFLAEVGAVGAGLALCVFIRIIRTLLKIRLRYAPSSVEVKGLNSLITLWFVLPIASLGVDSYIFLGFWIILGITLFFIKTAYHADINRHAIYG